MNQEKYWEEFYKEQRKYNESSFARLCLPYIKGEVVELGSGNGRDLDFFLANGLKATGVDSAFENEHIIKDDIANYIKTHQSPLYVYTRFVWHSIDNDLQVKIIDWSFMYLFIEARTEADRNREKTFGNHQRNYVDVAKLVSQLKMRDFEIIHLQEGKGFSKFGKEDPHLVRIIARRTC